MKNLLLKIYGIILILFSSTTYVFGQESYPIPNKTPTRLFYIQHSNNHNTFVYDAQLKNDSIDIENPIKEYRIVYTEGGVIRPLTRLQKHMAYGLSTNYISNNLFEMYLAANKTRPFFLTLDSNSKPIVYITINNQKLILDRIFVKLKNNFSVIHVEADYILFEGKDFHSLKEVSEKYYLDK
ncbi:DUF4833 domain-containing protein [Xanthomarina sp. F2636L]|uniref:DUF4833 domain-containing protein n=1 Tax=Xanthomarina sp. F2636L TaxID=2996018 RepID=UPI00225E3CB2|nr:DUF4833 domain-containing protein [Xanthomarina sp. F2636L]MCX7550410.1 DUF4833 domain-containing protein [Xanthomarina sp. F2636L]